MLVQRRNLQCLTKIQQVHMRVIETGASKFTIQVDNLIPVADHVHCLIC